LPSRLAISDEAEATAEWKGLELLEADSSKTFSDPLAPDGHNAIKVESLRCI
jgi:hypothetical protein